MHGNTGYPCPNQNAKENSWRKLATRLWAEDWPCPMSPCRGSILPDLEKVNDRLKYYIKESIPVFCGPDLWHKLNAKYEEGEMLQNQLRLKVALFHN